MVKKNQANVTLGDNNITLKRHETILGVSTAKSKIVWEKPDDFGYVWGPYAYRLDGKRYIYFTSGPETDFGYGHPSSYVLENSSPDPFEGTYSLDFRYNNNTADAINMKLGVNQEEPSDISFASNAGFDANFDIKTVYNIKLKECDYIRLIA